MAQIIILLILSIVLALLVLFLILCYSDYRQLQENDRYDRMMCEQFKLRYDSFETYEAMMREAERYWENGEEVED